MALAMAFVLVGVDGGGGDEGRVADVMFFSFLDYLLNASAHTSNSLISFYTNSSSNPMAPTASEIRYCLV